MFTEPEKGDRGIVRKEEFKAYDICDCTNYDVIALEEEDDGVVKVEFDDDYILYAQWEEDGEYWEIDTGDCH